MNTMKSIFAGFWACVLICAACSTTVFAEGEAPNVAPTPITNEVELAQAFTTGGTYQLTSSFALTTPLDVTSNVTLDLNGQTISAALSGGLNGDFNGTQDVGAIDIRFGGALTVGDSALAGGGTITNSGARPVLFNAGTLTLHGGTIEATNNYAVKTFGVAATPSTFTMTGGKLTSAITTLWNNGGSVTLSGGEVAGSLNPAFSDQATISSHGMMAAGNVTRAQLTISDGARVTSKNSNAIVMWGCDFTMTGGEVTATFDRFPVSATDAAISIESGSAFAALQLSGGHVSGRVGIYDCMVSNPDLRSRITIAAQAEITATDGIGINTNGILTMTGGTITSTKQGIYVTFASGGWPTTTAYGEITEISGGTITSTTEQGVYNRSGTIGQISGGTITGATYAVYNNKTLTAISGGTLTGNKAALYNSENGEITEISGGTLSGGQYALRNYFTIGTISGGTFTGNGATAILNGGNGVITEISGGIISGGQSAIYNYNTVSTISGGTFTGTVCALYGGDGSPDPIDLTVPAGAAYGASRFYGGDDGRAIRNNAQGLTAPAGYNFSVGTLPSNGKNCYYLTRNSEVTFDSHGGTSVASATVENGQLLPQPAQPTLAGSVFAGWYQEEAGTNPWNFDTEVTAAMTLHAKWSPTYALTVIEGTGGGKYVEGAQVSIVATDKQGAYFDRWVVPDGVIVADPFQKATTLTMPAAAVTVIAAYGYINDKDDDDDGRGENKTPIILDGKIENIGTATQTKDENTVSPDQNRLEQELKNAKGEGGLIIPIADTREHATAELVLKNVQELAKKNSSITVSRGEIEYRILATSIDTEALMEALGATDAAKVPLTIRVSKSDTPVSISGSEVILPPISFTILASYGGKTIEIDNFGHFVSRSVQITPEQAKRITTAVVTLADGSCRHVPTNVTQRGGKWYADIYSLTNSRYVLIFNEVNFSDTTGTWYETAVEELAGRKIVAGVGDNRFEGERSITRAEFAAILVRALGLPPSGRTAFADVPADAWYCGAVSAAADYGIVNGVGNGLYQPAATITRQEVMVMIARAAKLADFTGESGIGLPFRDAAEVGAWAKEAVVFNVSNALVLGSDGAIRPKDEITRAESATILRRFLQKANLIDIRVNGTI